MIAQRPPERRPSETTPAFPGQLVSVFHFGVLGAVFPLAPLFLLRTTGLNWIETGLALAAFPAAVAVTRQCGRPIRRLADRLSLTAVDGFVAAHLAAAGVSMGFAAWWDAPETSHLDWPVGLVWLVAYVLLLTPTLTWHSEMVTSSGKDGAESVSWRLWGAIGFLLPAWLSEGVLVAFDEFRPAVLSHRVLPVMAGWFGIAAAAAALIYRSNLTVQKTPAEALHPQRVGLLLMIGVGLVIALQRMHWLWTAPFFSVALQSHDSATPVVHRLIAVSQVFELLALLGLGFCAKRFGVRTLLVAATALLLARSVLFGVISQTAMPGVVQLGCFFVGQTLQGAAIGGFLGGLGVAMLPGSSEGRSSRIAILLGIAGTAGCIAGGCLTGLLAGQLDLLAPGDLPRQIGTGTWTVQLGGWGGVWWMSTLPALAAVLILCIAPLPTFGQSSTPTAEISTREPEREHVRA